MMKVRFSFSRKTGFRKIISCRSLSHMSTERIRVSRFSGTMNYIYVAGRFVESRDISLGVWIMKLGKEILLTINNNL